MNKTYLFAIATALMAAPLVMAHNPANPLATPDGTPKLYCEDRFEWYVHDYGAPATGVFLQGYEDGNLEDCDGVSSTGEPCAGFEDPADPLSFYAGLCGFNSPVADWDFHAEYARGGAWLLSCQTGCGVSGAGAGTDGCWGGDEAHHGEFPTVSVDDAVLGSSASFWVAADHLPPSDCGDFESETSFGPCIGSCGVPFISGLDGSYQVYVEGSVGHVSTW